MKIESFLNAVTEYFLGGNAEDKQADARLAGLNRGVLDVAMMIAAIDGEILPAEIAAYNRLLGECRGMSKADVPAATEAMLRKIGFLTSLKQSGISDRECVVSLVREAKTQLPEGLSSVSASDRRRALVFWTVMALSDGTYSPVEQAAIHALTEFFAPELCGDFLDQVKCLVGQLAEPASRDKAWRAIEKLVAGTV